MTLPPGFHFSQASLQDFADCPRRFQLRFLLRLAWPAVESEPALENERYMQLGQRFHRLAQQHLLGLPEERLAPPEDEPELPQWWANYLSCGAALAAEAGGPERPMVEISLSAPFGGHRLVAKYDALALLDAPTGKRVRILDWKTSRSRPRRERLASRLQTRVYPYLVCAAGACLNRGAAFLPEQVEMVYWFSAFPEKPEVFRYSAEQYRQDEAFLLGLIRQIESLAAGDFLLASASDACRFCTYRSLCDRGTCAGTWEEEEEWSEGSSPALDLDLDFEQIAEIKY
jgi:hypothetical protein